MIVGTFCCRSKTVVGVFAVAALLTGSVAAKDPTVRLTEQTSVRFASVKQARRILGATDVFVSQLSPFDRAVRLKSGRPVTTKGYLKFAASQAKKWSKRETTKYRTLITKIGRKLSWLSVRLPSEILLIKTSGKEEGDSPYTRGGAIVLPRGILNAPDDVVEQVFLHELFHIISQYNPALRGELYGIVGFGVCNDIEWPPGLAARRITNPDAPLLDVFIELKHSARSITAAPVLLSKVEQYDPSDDRPFPLGYLDFKFLELEGDETEWRPRMVNGKPQLFDPAKVSGFHEKIGRNTQYTIHPEEVLADNFVLVVQDARGVPSPRILTDLRRVLSGE